MPGKASYPQLEKKLLNLEKENSNMKGDYKKFDFDGLFTFEMANNHMGSVAHGKKIIDEMAKIAKKEKIKAAIKFQFRDIKTFVHPDSISYSRKN